MAGKRESVSSYLVRRIGVRRALMVETFVMLWSMYEAAEGREPTSVVELGDSIGRDRSTLFRWQADFREGFAEFGWQTPRDLLDYMAAGSRPVSVRQVGKFTVPVAT